MGPVAGQVRGAPESLSLAVNTVLLAQGAHTSVALCVCVSLVCNGLKSAIAYRTFFTGRAI